MASRMKGLSRDQARYLRAKLIGRSMERYGGERERNDLIISEVDKFMGSNSKVGQRELRRLNKDIFSSI